MRGSNWWSNQGWLNRGLLIACATVVMTFVINLMLVWIFLEGDRLVLTILLMLALFAFTAVLVVYSIVRVFLMLVSASVAARSGRIYSSSRVLNIATVVILVLVGFGVSMAVRPVGTLHFRYQALFGKHLFDGVKLSGRDLSDVNLNGVFFISADLKGTDLSGTDIRNGHLEGSNLEGADLSGADIRSGNLTNANLERADLSGADVRNGNLTAANLEGADLRGTNLANASFSRTNLLNALVDDQTVMDETEGWLLWEIVNEGAAGRDLRGVDLSWAILPGANLREAKLNGGRLCYADLRGADLAGADLRDADLRGANLERADLRGTNLAGANLKVTNLQKTLVDDQTVMDDIDGWLVWEIVNEGAPGRDLRGIDLSLAVLPGSNLSKANLSGASLRQAKLGGGDLRGADLTYADLRDSDLCGARLANANLRGADLSGADLDYADLRGADLGGARLRYAGLQGADLSEANLRAADAIWFGTEIILEGARYDDETKWDMGYDPAAEGAIYSPIE